MAWCTNCSSPGLLAPPFPPKMCWICICIAGPSKPFWPMKTSSKIPTAGVPIRLVDRSFGRSSANGSGISAWNSDNTCLPPRCVPLNLLRRLRLRHRQPSSHRRSLRSMAPSMGTEVVYGGLSRLGFHASTGWKPALSRQSSALSARMPTGAQWLLSSLVCGPHRRLPPMRGAPAVSRKPCHQQTTTRQCGDLPSLFAPDHCLCTSHGCAFASASTTTSPPACSCPLAGLATLSDPSPLAQRDTQRNRRCVEGLSNAGTHAGDQRACHDPATTGSLASLLE